MAEQLSLGDKRGVAWGIDDRREPLDHRQRVLEVAGGRAEEAAKSLPPGGPVAVSVHERFRCRLLIDARSRCGPGGVRVEIVRNANRGAGLMSGRAPNPVARARSIATPLQARGREVPVVVADFFAAS